MSLVSDKAVAVLGACTQVIMVFTLLIRTLCGGAGAIAAQNIGAKNRVKTLLAFMYAMLIAIVFGVVFSSILFFGRHYIASWMGLSGETLNYAEAYLFIIGPAFFLLSLRTGYTTIITVKGKAKVSLWCALISNGVNILFNGVLVLGWFGAPKLGVTGVAIATAMAYGVYLLLIAYLAHQTLFVRFVFPRDIGRRLHALSRPVLGIAIPNCGDLLSYSLFQVVIMSIVIRISENAGAAYTYVHQVMAFIVIWSYAVAQGQSILTAHLVGAKQFTRAETEIKWSIVRCLAVALPATLTLYLFAGNIFQLFTDNREILAMTSAAILAYIGIEIGRAFNATLSFSLASAGDARYPATLGIIFNWLIGVPMAIFLGVFLGWGLLGALLGVAIDELLRAPWNYWRLTSKKWIRSSSN